ARPVGCTGRWVGPDAASVPACPTDRAPVGTARRGRYRARCPYPPLWSVAREAAPPRPRGQGDDLRDLRRPCRLGRGLWSGCSPRVTPAAVLRAGEADGSGLQPGLHVLLLPLQGDAVRPRQPA